MHKSTRSPGWRTAAVVLLGALAFVAAACGGEEIVEKIVVQTVVVEKAVPGEKVVETVIVEKVVAGETVKVIETVIVEKIIAGETVKVVETVIVERPVTRIEKVVETVIVEKVIAGETVKVVETVIVEKQVIVERVVVATPTPAPVVAVREPAGKMTIVIEDIGTPLYLNFNMAWPANDQNWSSGVLEGLTRTALDNWTLENVLAESWRIEDRRGTSFLVVDILKGVQFHKGWGEMTAQDMAWSFQDLMKEGTKHTSFGSLDQLYERDGIRAVDTHTIEFQMKRKPLAFKGPPTGNSAGVISKKAFDENGDKWSTLNAVGTGPFQVIKHVADNEKVTEAFDGHWRFTPGFKTIQWLEVPEPSTRIAMIKTGEADMAQIGVVDLARVAGEPGITLIASQNANRRGVNVWFQGTLYATRDLDGNPIDRPDPPTNRPWVGDINDPDSMDKASKFRRAISVAIDRDGINESFLNGTGCKYIIMKMDNCNPFFQAKWDYDFDKDAAMQLLKDAGAEGATIQYAIPSGLGSTHSEISEALPPMWEAVGLNVDITKAAYSALRPAMLARTSAFMFTFIWGNSTDLCSLPNSPGVQHSFNPAMEHDRNTDEYLVCRDIGDLGGMWEVLEDYYQWYWDNHWAIGTVTWETVWPTGPRIAEWAIGPAATSNPNWLHTAIPAK